MSDLQDLGNKTAEKALLGAILVKPVNIYEVGLSPQHFQYPKNREMFKCMREASSGSDPEERLDAVAFSEWLEKQGKLGDLGGAHELAGLANSCPSPDNIEHYEKIIRKAHSNRELYRFFEQEQQKIGEKPPEVICERMEKKANETGAVDEYQNTKLIDVAGSLLDRLKGMQEPGLSEDSLSTEQEQLDHALNGLDVNDFTIISARPGIGKTTLSMQICDDMSRVGHNVMWMSWEMTREEIFQKMVARNSNISINDMEHGRLNSAQAEKITETIERLEDRDFYISEMSGANIYNAKQQIRRADADHGVDVAVIDYLQLMENHLEDEDEFAALRDISKQLNKFSNREKIPIIGIVSLNQSGQAYGVSQVEYDCNNHISMSAVTEKNNGVEQDTNERWIVIRKARNGPKGTLKGVLKGEISKILWEE